MRKLNLKGKRVLVTGSEGYIGSHVVEKLLKSGADVRAFVMYNFKGDLGWIGHLRNDVEIYPGDVRDYNAVHDAMENVDIVYNLAASISIPYSAIHPREVFETNVFGAFNVLMAAKELGTKRVVQVSTSEVFGNPKKIPIDENHPKNPQSPYAASKVAADSLCHAFYSSYSLPVVVIRPFNTFGPRQSPRAITPSVIMQLMDGDVIRSGNLYTTRDFTFVDDTAEGIILGGITRGIEGEEINLGTRRETKIKDWIALIAKLMGKEKYEIKTEEYRKRTEKLELVRLCADNTKASKLLKWKPKYTLEAGLKKTIAWFATHRKEFGNPYYAEHK
jgi:nucleoside-diphosphate-sugar epimerase